NFDTEATRSELALGGWKQAFASWIKLSRHAQRPAECLEYGLGLMVGVAALQVVYMQRHQRMIDKTLEKLMYEIDIEFADQPAGVIHGIFQPRPARQVDHDSRQCFIQGDVSVSIPADALFVPNGFGKGLAD